MYFFKKIGIKIGIRNANDAGEAGCVIVAIIFVVMIGLTFAGVLFKVIRWGFGF